MHIDFAKPRQKVQNETGMFCLNFIIRIQKQKDSYKTTETGLKARNRIMHNRLNEALLHFNVLQASIYDIVTKRVKVSMYY